jgi:hypothetical protein
MKRFINDAEIDELRNNFPRKLSKYLQFDTSKPNEVFTPEHTLLVLLFYTELCLHAEPRWMSVLVGEMKEGISSFGVLCALVLAGCRPFKADASQYLEAILDGLICDGCADQHPELVKVVMNGLRGIESALVDSSAIAEKLTCLGIDWQANNRKDAKVS